MEKLVIDRKIWLRGEGAMSSSLLRSTDGKRCCVGIYLAGHGVNDLELVGRSAAHSLSLLSVPAECRWLLDPECPAEASNDAWRLYSDNDVESYDDGEAERELLVAKAFADHGIEVEFVG